jgi:Ser/Thr protein kinase RdoA (MazF antagonist)
VYPFVIVKLGEIMFDLKKYFEKLTNNLNLGDLIEEPSRVSGGLTHKMYKVFTTKGRFIVKLLNPNIMKRPTALNNFATAERFEDILKDNNIDAIYILTFNKNKMQYIDGQYFYVYVWYDGKSLKDNEIRKCHCENIGNVLAQIHNISINKECSNESTKSIDWKYYIDMAKEKKSPIYNMLYDKVELLNKCVEYGNDVIDKMPKCRAICHNDLDVKNVLWIDDEFKIIDLECLGYSNPYLELYSLALSWAGYEACGIDFYLFKTFIDSYFKNSKLNRDIDWEVLYYANNSRLEWLEYNIKRALMLETDSEEEQQLGIKEVKETLERIVYYDAIKNELLSNCV